MLTGAPSGRVVHSSSRGFTRAGVGVVGFNLVCVASLGRTKGSSGPFVFACVHTGCRRIHTGSRGYTHARLGIVGFIRVRVGLRCRSWGSSGSFRCAWVHSGALKGRWVHCGLRGFTPALLNFGRLILFRMESLVRS